MDNVNKEDLQLRYQIFQKAALEDQGNFYRTKRGRNIQAERGVNIIRASLALATGVAASIAAALGQTYLAANGQCAGDVASQTCANVTLIINIFVIASIVLPAVAGFFSSLSDLYQWERLATVYENANQNLIYADALSPDEEESYTDYFTSFQAYTDGALQVMSDETKQWGQAIRKPEKTELFIEDMRRRAERVSRPFDKQAKDQDEPGA